MEAETPSPEYPGPDPLTAELGTAWLEELGTLSDESPQLTRTFLSPALTLAKDRIAEWMRAASLEVFEDEAGNLIGRRDCGDPLAGTLVCGSHLDTVRNAGKFDGALGVVAGILAAAEIHRRGHPLPHHLEVVGFSDEEGVRFQTAFLGSQYYTGQLNEFGLTRIDADGVTVRKAMADHTPAFPPPPRRGKFIGYLEAHIEQGPVLENAGLALGVVTSIAGQTRVRLTLGGCSGHAGTTPMSLRHDALTGAAECVLLIEERARAAPSGLVATVGELQIAFPASNVIPGQVEFTLDIREANAEVLEKFCRDLFAELEIRMKRRDLTLQIAIAFTSPPVPCDLILSAALEKIVLDHQSQCLHLASGAGHDAVALAAVAPMAMLFVRCRKGLSHHPDEFVEPEDITLAIRILTEFLATYRA